MKREYNLIIGKFHFLACLRPLPNCKHGPASENWPWYKLLGFLYCPTLTVTHPSTGKRLWIYIRNVGGIYFDVYMDRRPA